MQCQVLMEIYEILVKNIHRWVQEESGLARWGMNGGRRGTMWVGERGIQQKVVSSSFHQSSAPLTYVIPPATSILPPYKQTDTLQYQHLHFWNEFCHNGCRKLQALHVSTWVDAMSGAGRWALGAGRWALGAGRWALATQWRRVKQKVVWLSSLPAKSKA
jgi:hypothetical protein